MSTTKLTMIIAMKQKRKTNQKHVVTWLIRFQMEENGKTGDTQKNEEIGRQTVPINF